MCCRSVGLWYAEIPHAIGYAEFFSRSHDAVIRVYDAAGNVVETHEHTGDLKECEVLHDQTHREIVYRPLQFQKRSQLFICARDETLSVATLNVNDPARWPSHECVTISYAKARRWSCSHVIPRD
jgi:hypothetical protein